MILRDRDGYFWEFNKEWQCWFSSERDELEGLSDCPDGDDEGLMFIISEFGPVECMTPVSRISLNDGTIEYLQL